LVTNILLLEGALLNTRWGRRLQAERQHNKGRLTIKDRKRSVDPDSGDANWYLRALKQSGTSRSGAVSLIASLSEAAPPLGWKSDQKIAACSDCTLVAEIRKVRCLGDDLVPDLPRNSDTAQ
jgi:hypothetical protein